METLTHADLQFCLRRTPKKILEALKARPNRAYVAGGFIRSVIAREDVNDIDIFVPSRAEGESLANELVAGREFKENKKPFHESANAFTVRGFFTTPQVIHRWTFEHPRQCIESFDFTIACAAFWWGGPLVPQRDNLGALGVGTNPQTGGWQSICDPRFYPDLASKRLIYRSPDRNEDAGGSLLRVLKFYQRGYRIPVDSLGAVIARFCQGLRLETLGGSEEFLATVFTGLLREVDPAIDPRHIAHLPAENAAKCTCKPGKPDDECPVCIPGA